MKHRIGFIGAGQMATALAKGFVAAGLVEESHVTACDPSASARDVFLRCLPQAVVGEPSQAVVAASEIVVIAVKPQHVDTVFAEIGALKGDSILFVSIAAGVTLQRLCAGVGSDRMVRVMPNTPCLVGAGAAGFCLGPGATEQDAATVSTLLGAVGVAVQLPEALLDAVTGLSGSGPAFVYQVIEALSDGGVRCGLSRDVAARLAAQTVLGAARMVLETGEHPGVLKDRVASPGGTTIAGLHALESGRLRATLIDAVVQATQRSKELGQ